MAAKYFVAATLKSKLQGTARSTVVLPRECRNDHVGVRPEHAPHRLAPAIGRPEHVQQPLGVLGLVTPARGLDADLALQQDRLDGGRRGFADRQPERQLRRRRVDDRLDGFDLEIQIEHDFSFSRSKYRPTSSQTSLPPDRPRQCRRIRPLSR